MEGKQKPVNMFSHRWSVCSQMIFGSYFVRLWKPAHSDRACLERGQRLLGQLNVSDETLNSSSWNLFLKKGQMCFLAICSHQINSDLLFWCHFIFFYFLANIFFKAIASSDIEAVFSSSDSAEPAGGTSQWHESRRDTAPQHAFQDSTRFSSPADVGAEHIEPSHQPREWASVSAGDRFKSNLWQRLIHI